jgi:two-component system alkaline phosphatase synthesis response regulator PhoP
MKATKADWRRDDQRDVSARRILLIEDEPGLVLTLTDRLESEGYQVQAASDGPGGLDRATRERWDVILLDVMLPGASGFDVCRDLRQRGVGTPVIMLTARGQVVDKVLGLKLGADDYLTKPFEMLELLARIEVQLRRRTKDGSAPTEYRFGDVVVNFRKAEVTRGGRVAELSAREFLLLKYFIEHREATLSRDELLNEVWGYHSMPSTRTVDVHVAWLRQKIEPNPRQPQYVLTVHGLGYKFVG